MGGRGAVESRVSAKNCQGRRGVGYGLCYFLIEWSKLFEAFARHLAFHAKSKICRNYHLLFDNAPCRKSNVVKKYKQKHKIKIIPFPAQSADINPIENLWCELDQAIKQKKPSNQNELFQVIEDGWKNILQCKLEKLVESMPKRINAVVTNKGNPTKH